MCIDSYLSLVERLALLTFKILECASVVLNCQILSLSNCNKDYTQGDFYGKVVTLELKGEKC